MYCSCYCWKYTFIQTNDVAQHLSINNSLLTKPINLPIIITRDGTTMTFADLPTSRLVDKLIITFVKIRVSTPMFVSDVFVYRDVTHEHLP
jgi:hypothetical protein